MTDDQSPKKGSKFAPWLGHEPPGLVDPPPPQTWRGELRRLRGLFSLSQVSTHDVSADKQKLKYRINKKQKTLQQQAESFRIITTVCRVTGWREFDEMGENQ